MRRTKEKKIILLTLSVNGNCDSPIAHSSTITTLRRQISPYLHLVSGNLNAIKNVFYRKFLTIVQQVEMFNNLVKSAFFLFHQQNNFYTERNNSTT